jgi:cytochrome c oxidase assembly factor CtaG
VRLAPPVAAIGCLVARSACAHGGPDAAGAADLGGALDWLTLDPFVLVPLGLLVVAYAVGTLRAGPERVKPARVAYLAGAVAMLQAALVWPLDALGERYFSAHMAQHMVLIALAPPLLVLASPWSAILRAAPAPARRRLAAPFGRRAARHWRGWTGSIAGLVALHAIAVWAWHLPVAFDLALRDDMIHRLEHVSFFATGLLFWRAVLIARRERALGAVGALFATLLHGGMLGALLTFAPRPLYATYAGRGAADALADQQLAGMIMWVPMAAVYVVAAMMLVARWMPEASAKPSPAPPPLSDRATG